MSKSIGDEPSYKVQNIILKHTDCLHGDELAELANDIFNLIERARVEARIKEIKWSVATLKHNSNYDYEVLANMAIKDLEAQLKGKE